MLILPVFLGLKKIFILLRLSINNPKEKSIRFVIILRVMTVVCGELCGSCKRGSS